MVLMVFRQGGWTALMVARDTQMSIRKSENNSTVGVKSIFSTKSIFSASFNVILKHLEFN
jgi:hypothetical protein